MGRVTVSYALHVLLPVRKALLHIGVLAVAPALSPVAIIRSETFGKLLVMATTTAAVARRPKETLMSIRAFNPSGSHIVIFITIPITSMVSKVTPSIVPTSMLSKVTPPIVPTSILRIVTPSIVPSITEFFIAVVN